MRGLFITGTDTEVGKTRIAAAMLRRAAQAGMSTVAMKPVAAGCDHTPHGWRNADALALQSAATVTLDYATVNPVALPEPVAPHLAAREAGRVLSLEALVAAYRDLPQADLAVVEGAGGWRVPLGDGTTLATLAKALGLEVVLVVGLRLGCLNHAQLTAEAIRADGCSLAGWVANCAGRPPKRADAQVATLREVLPAPCLGVVPRLSDASADAVSAHLTLP
ncbi:dethiobiotin synthase [Arhodomonas sp. AD133]|uniref:dethiobiotin synthase n=1 Tax=Arhodomonas sp. AD133 TaxID=3415009 RepID=UPI003EBF2407